MVILGLIPGWWASRCWARLRTGARGPDQERTISNLQGMPLGTSQCLQAATTLTPAPPSLRWWTIASSPDSQDAWYNDYSTSPSMYCGKAVVEVLLCGRPARLDGQQRGPVPQDTTEEEIICHGGAAGGRAGA